MFGLAMYATLHLQEGMSIVSLIGLRMKATIGVAGAMFTALAKNSMHDGFVLRLKCASSFGGDDLARHCEYSLSHMVQESSASPAKQ